MRITRCFGFVILITINFEQFSLSAYLVGFIIEK